jgi:mono/diheme cytochrome c family protein
MPRNLKLPVVLMVAGAAWAQTPSPKNPAFERSVTPLLGTTCKGCHNDQLSSGGLSITPFLDPTSLTKYREGWEMIVQKVQSGEMPPKGIPRPPQAQIDALVGYVNGEFERADTNVKPDPGHLVAHRLNRYEYSNSVRDLLGVDFHAEQDFPTDDSSYGFDNISSALTISPVLTERYLAAAEKIAVRAIGADPLPKTHLTEIAARSLQRVDGGTADADFRVEYDGDYHIKIHLAGARPPEAPPLKSLEFYMDRKLLSTIALEAPQTGPQTLDLTLWLPSGAHVFRARFDDEYSRNLGRGGAGAKGGAPATGGGRGGPRNRTIDSLSFDGPYASKTEAPGRKLVLICDPKTGPACIDKITANFAHRAYRRPVTKAEVAQLAKFVGIAQAKGLSVEQGIQLMIEATLVSPDFLFRIERDPGAGTTDTVHRVTDLELASRLSYFLWSSTPDDQLLALAESQKLHQPAVLDAQVKRMLADSRSEALGNNFAGQWLELRNLNVVTPDTRKYTGWGPDLRDAMKTETSMFFDHILRDNRPISEFLNARYTYLNDVLAKHYGIAGVTGSDFRKVDLTTDERGGLLGMASVLTVSSYPTRTSVVIRGKYVLENILGTPPPPPPPDVPALDETKIGSQATLRQQMEQHRNNPVCASCHSKMDVLGFGLENYDGVGKWRTQDGKFPVDSSGTMPNGKTFNGPAEMRAVLAGEMPQFAHCLTEKMLTYSLGRGLEAYDRRTVTQIEKALAADGYKFQTLIYEIVRSMPFQMRRGEAVQTKLENKELAQK